MSRRSDDTVAYYDAHAEAFVRDTLGVDMAALYEPFLALVPPGGEILDAGCGSGRDARAFRARGYSVTAFDASAEMARRASELLGEPVAVGRLEDMAYREAFDGVWACASLLHCPRAEVDGVLRRCARALRAGGVMYLSFKRGEKEEVRGGRLFTDYTQAALVELIGRCIGLAVLQVWETADARPGRVGQWWVNGLVKKEEAAVTCYRCKQAKPVAEFITRIDERHYRMCRACVSQILATRPRGKGRLAHTDTHRTCYLCRRVVPVSGFTLRSNGTYFSACKECNRHVFAQRRRARLLAADGSYTVEEWKQVLARHPGCPGCGRGWDDIPPLPSGVVITVDHVVPISKGGTNSIENIRPLCYSCNSKKGAKETM